jgi:hypothetical protein
MRNAGLRSLLSSTALLLLVAACSGSSSVTDSGTPPNASCLSGCGNGLSCVQNSDFPTGTCTAVCAGNSGCPSGTTCSPTLSSGQSYCLQDCTSSACSGTQVCTITADGRVCLPASEAVASPISCAPPQLLMGATAGPGSDPGCRTPVVPSALAAGDVQDLGSHSPGTQVSFTVPAGAAGFSIISQASSGQNAFLDCGPGVGVLANVPVPSPILTPAGGTFFDYSNFIQFAPLDLTTAPLVFFSVGGQQPYTAALTFPNTTAGLNITLDGGLPGGQWTFDVNDYANQFAGPGGCDAGTLRNTYDVQVVVTPGPLPATGQLAVDVYLVTNTLTAGSAVSSPVIQAFASRYASFYANAGLCVSSMTFHDVPTWALNKYRSVNVDDTVDQDPCSDFRQMFTLASGGRSMALFFVDDLVATGEPPGDTIVGKDGAIPGVASYNGTIAGGSVVLASDLFANANCTSVYEPTVCGSDTVATISAHETGHFLGMFHPTEATGDAFDPISDTASCVCALCETDPSSLANCSDGGQATVVDNAVCSGATQLCGGSNLLMFWILTTDMRGDISPQEAAVMRANPLISAP